MYDLLKAKKTNVMRSDSVHTSVTWKWQVSMSMSMSVPMCECVQLYWMRHATYACVSWNQDYLNLVDVDRWDISCTIKETGFFIA